MSKELIRILLSILAICFLSLIWVEGTYAACNNPAPRALPFVAPSGQSCPGNYSQTGSTCNPSSSWAGYAFVVPQGQGCPGNYSQQGSICVANSNACYAYYSGGASCPGGYATMGKICISN